MDPECSDAESEGRPVWGDPNHSLLCSRLGQAEVKVHACFVLVVFRMMYLLICSRALSLTFVDDPFPNIEIFV